MRGIAFTLQPDNLIMSMKHIYKILFLLILPLSLLAQDTTVVKQQANVLAQAAVLTAAVSYAFAGVYGRRFRRMGIEPILTATGQVTASTILLFPIAMIVGVGGRPRQRRLLDRARLCLVFPYSRHRRRDQPLACHIPDSRERHRHGQLRIGRTPRGQALCRFGFHWRRACCDRWPLFAESRRQGQLARPSRG